MHSIRRAVLFSAASATRSLATKPQTLRAACLIGRSTVVPRIAVSSALRCFSSTARVANSEAATGEENDHDASEPTASAEDDIAPHEQVDSTKPADLPSSQMHQDETPYGVFIRNMVFEANEDHLREAFEKYGEITKAAVARDARGLSRGYGFVWFTNEESREKAVSGTNGSFWHGRRVQVSPRAPSPNMRSRSGSAMGPTRSMYIGNIPYETTDAELNKIFRELDDVTDVRVAVDRTTGWPRGFAHADFATVDACTKAIEKLGGITIGGRELKLDYAMESFTNKRK